jgi:hypothetical protein
VSVDTDTSILEQIFALESDSGVDIIHWACEWNSDHVICGAVDDGDTVPDWVEANCEVCVDMDERSDYENVVCRICRRGLS